MRRAGTEIPSSWRLAGLPSFRVERPTATIPTRSSSLTGAVSRRSPLQKSPEGRSHNRFWGRTWRAHDCKGSGRGTARKPYWRCRDQSARWLESVTLRPLASLLRTGNQSATLPMFVSQHVQDLRLIGAAAILCSTNGNGCGSRSGRKGITLDGDELRKGTSTILSVLVGVLYYIYFNIGKFMYSVWAAPVALGGALTWGYQVGSARLGGVDLFACEISTLCRVYLL